MGFNGVSRTGRRLAAKWRPLLRFYQVYGNIVYSLLLVKNLLVVALNHKHLQHLRWLDCYLPGRLLIGPRIPETSKFVSVLVCLLLFLHQLIMRELGANFNIFCLEWVAKNHRQLESMSPLARWLSGSDCGGGGGGLADSEKLAQQPHSRHQQHPALDEFALNQLDTRQLVWRPSRTLWWRKLYAYSHLMSLLMVGLGHLLSGLTICWMLGPMFLTRRGFELTHRDCVRFIVGQTGSLASANGAGQLDFIYKPNRSSSLEAIYAAGRRDPIILPYVDLVPLNVYHVVRVAFDLIENMLVWHGIGLCYWHQLYFVLAFSVDTNVYALYLRKQLANLTRQLHHRAAPLKWAPPGGDSIQRRTPLETPWQAAGRKEMLRLQGAVLDLFNFVALYNPCVSLSTLFHLLIWLFYTFVIFARTLKMSRLRTVAEIDQGVQMEFIFLFCWGLVIMLALLASASTLDSNLRKLYTALASAMSLDQDAAGTKSHWATLLQHFQPRQLHCFTIFNHTSLSWLFSLKIFAWVVSALVIVESL